MTKLVNLKGYSEVTQGLPHYTQWARGWPSCWTRRGRTRQMYRRRQSGWNTDLRHYQAYRLNRQDHSLFIASHIPTCMTTYALMECHPPHGDFLTASTRIAKFQRILVPTQRSVLSHRKNRVNGVLVRTAITKVHHQINLLLL